MTAPRTPNAQLSVRARTTTTLVVVAVLSLLVRIISPGGGDPSADLVGLAGASGGLDQAVLGEPDPVLVSEEDEPSVVLDQGASADPLVTVVAEQRIGAAEGGLTAPIDPLDSFGRAVTGIGDLDGDGVADLAVGVPGDDDGGQDRGALHILFLNSDNTVRAEQKISGTTGGLTTALLDGDGFGFGMAGIGDLDGDGVPDLVVGAADDALYVMFLNADGTVKGEQRISATTDGSFRWPVAAIGDLDDDGLPDIIAGTVADDDDDADPGAVSVLFLNADGTVRSEQQVSATADDGFPVALDDGDRFGAAMAGIGDLDGDGVEDVVVAAPGRDALYVLFLNTDGTIKTHREISDAGSALAATAVANLGPVNDDGHITVAIGLANHEAGVADSGAIRVLTLSQDGSVVAGQTLSNANGDLTGPLGDDFGVSVTGLGDLDGDGSFGLAVGAPSAIDRDPSGGAVHVLDLRITPPPAPPVDVAVTLEAQETEVAVDRPQPEATAVPEPQELVAEPQEPVAEPQEPVAESVSEDPFEPSERTDRWLDGLDDPTDGIDIAENRGEADTDVDYAVLAEDYDAVVVDGDVLLVPHGESASDAIAMHVIGGADEPENQQLDVSPIRGDAAVAKRLAERHGPRLGTAAPLNPMGSDLVTTLGPSTVAVDPALSDDDGAVEFREVLPGVDIVYSADGEDVEYSFIVEPGGDPAEIELDFSGAVGLNLRPDGDLLIEAETGPDFLSTAPITYQLVGGDLVLVDSSYVLKDDGTIGFALGSYDPRLPVVIDPTFVTVETAAGSYTTGSTIDLPVPATVATDDLMIAQIAYSATGGGIITAPAGWTLIDETGGNGITQALYRRIATVSEPAQYSFTLASGATDTAAGAITLYDDVDTSSPIDVVAAQTNPSAAAVTAPSVTTTVNDTTVVAFFAVRDDGAATPPTGMTERTDRTSSSGGAAADETVATAADETFGTAGATGVRTATVDASAGSVGTLVALAPAQAPATKTNLLMVTADGGFTNGDDAAKKTLFESWGWTVTGFTGSSSAGAYATAAAANDVLFFSSTASGTSSIVADLDIGVLIEILAGWQNTMYAGSNPTSWTSDTTLDIIDNGHYITSPFSTGSLTIHTSNDDVNYWNSSTLALPAGVTVLAESPTSASHEALLVADTGATLYSANTAPNRRVWFPSDYASPSVFTTDYETLMERSLDWAAGNDAASVPYSSTVIVNSTGDAIDNNIGNDLCSTGGTNADGDPECTLRAALAEADASSTVDAIRFNIPTTDSGYSASPLAYTLTPNSGYPLIEQTVTIDATTQPGWSGDPIIQLDGSSATGATAGLALRAGNSTIRGFVVHSFPDEGLEIDGTGGAGDGNVLAGNWVGLDASGAVVGNTDHGILVTDSADGNLIGGVGANDGNRVAGSGGTGILVRTSSFDNAVLGNEVWANTGLGIDLDEDGVTSNDAGDGDSGSNDLLNTPSIVSASVSGGTVTVTYDLDVPANPDQYRVEFFSNPSGSDTSGSGEGEVLISSVTTAPGVGLTHAFAGALGDEITATVTEINSGASSGFGPTSEFAVNETVAPWNLVTATFQEGTNGYSGTVDTWISDNVPNQDNSAGTLLEIDASPNQDGLIRFDGIIGAGAGQIPTNAKVQSAKLVLDPTDPAGTGATITLHRVLRSWVETDTWNTLSSGVSTDDVEASSTADTSHTGDLDQTTNPVTITGLGPTVQAWVDGGDNRGWLLTLDTTDGWDARSSENTSTADRPRLEVSYVLCEDPDADGLCSHEEDANTDLDGDPSTNPGPDTDGDTTPNYLDSDDDDDGIATSAENADPNGDGDPRDAKDSDRDGQPDWLDTTAGASSTPVADEQKISDLVGGFGATIDDDDEFGVSVAGIGDIDGDGVSDAVVGANFDDDGGSNRGAVYVLFLNANGTVKGEQKISDTDGGFSAVLNDDDRFGRSVAGIGDVDGDGIGDLAVGAFQDDDGGSNHGAVYVLFLNADGSVKAEQKISDTAGGFASVLASGDNFGRSVTGLGDLDGDGVGDVAIGANRADDGGNARGEVYVLFLNANGTVKGEQKISDITGGLGAALDDGDRFGTSVAGVGDVDGDGIEDLAVGAHYDGDGGTDRGAVYVLFLNANGTVKGEQKISDAVGGLAATLDDGDNFGHSVTGLGDIDGDGRGDLAIGARADGDGGTARGAVYLVSLNADGSAKSEQKISDTAGGFTAVLDDGDLLGTAVSSIGDLDDDGRLNLIVGVPGDDDGGTGRGAIYVIDLTAQQQIVDATADAANANSGVATLVPAAANDNDINGDSIVVVDATDPTNGSTTTNAVGTVTYRSTPAHSGPDTFDYWAIDAGASMTHYWGLAGNGDDGFGTSDGTITGATTVAGDFGDALSFDEVDDRLTVPDFDYGTDFTISFDFKVDDNSGSTFQYIYSHGDVNNANAINVFLIEAGQGVDPNKIRTVARDLDDTLDNSALDVDIASLIGDGLWHTYTLTGGAGGLTVLIDGVAQATDPTRGTAGIDPSGSLFLGARQDLNTARYYGGLLDTVQIYDRTLSAAEVSDIVNEVNVATVTMAVTACNDSDSDGLWDCEEDANTDADDDPSTNPGPDTDGDTTANYLDNDDDGDSTLTSAENADPNGDGDPRDAKDTDRDGQPDYLDSEAGSSSTPIANEQKISNTQGGLTTTLDGFDAFGRAVASLGDVDGDGTNDVAVGAYADDDGGSARGAVYVLFLNADGTVKGEQKISDTVGGFSGVLEDSDFFGLAIAGPGDVDGDGVNDLVVGASGDDDGGNSRGAVYVLFLNADGTVKGEQKISDTVGGLTTGLGNADSFGGDIAAAGDLDGDGVHDLVVGAGGDDDGGTARGAVYVLFLNADGTVKGEQKISDTTGGLTATLDDSDAFGFAVEGLGDVDGDGTDDIGVGAYGDDDGGTSRGAVYVLFLNTDGTVKGEQKISDAVGGLTTTLEDSDYFGYAVGGVGDVDADGVNDVTVGAYLDDDGGTSRGAVYVLFLNTDGTVKGEQKVSDTSGGLTATLDDWDTFGGAVAGIGDLDGDGELNLLVGAHGDDDGSSAAGAVYVLDLAPAACGTADSDSDGLLDCEEDANTDADDDPSTNPGPDTDGDTTANYLDNDDDGDGTLTSAENADPNSDGDPRDAIDSDHDGEPDYLDVEAGPSSTALADEQKISNTNGGLTGPWQGDGWAGTDVATIGDLDGDGVVDVAIGANGDDDGGSNRGAVWVLFLNADGTVKAEQKISDATGGLTASLGDLDQFGSSVSGPGDLDGDGIPDLAVGARYDDDGGVDRGAVYVLFLNTDGTVKAEQKISDTTAGLTATLDDSDQFGHAVEGVGDLDGDGVPDLAVGVWGDDDGGSQRGAVYLLFLNADGTVKAEQKISDTTGGLAASIPNGSNFGVGLAELGDVDGDGTTDLAVGAWNDTDGGSTRGAVYVLFLNTDGTVAGDQKISATAGGFGGTIDAGDDFGAGVTGVGDLDGDGVPDLVAGAPRDDDGGSDRGALWVLTLNNDGTVATTNKISASSGGLTGPLDDSDQFGYEVTSLGDLDGDGTLNLLVGAWGDDDGASTAGAVYVLDLSTPSCGTADSDSDGLLDCEEDANTDADDDPSTNPGPDTDGDTTGNYLDADDDGDGIATSAENADPNSNGDPRDAVDTDRDGQADWLDEPAGTAAMQVVTEQKISDTAGGFTATLDDGDELGRTVTALGDLDGDGITDVAAGMWSDDDGGTNRGAVHILFLNADGTVKTEQKISDTVGGLTATLDDADAFGHGLAVIGDLDGDGINDLAVGAQRDDDGGTDRGAVHILFLNADGTVKAERKISDTTGGLTASLDDDDLFGHAVANIGDLDGDGTPDLAVAAHLDDDGGTDRGAVYILFLNPNGTVKAEQKISDTVGGLTAALADNDRLGMSVGGLGDVDGDGIMDLIAGASTDDDGGSNRGAVHVLLLNADGTVKADQEISGSAGGFPDTINNFDEFGYGVAGLGDLDGDGVPDAAIGARFHDTGGSNHGAVWLIALNTDGTVKDAQIVTDGHGGFTGPLADDGFGSAIAGIGDLDGDGPIGLLVGAPGDDDGGSDRGALWVLDLELDAAATATVDDASVRRSDLVPTGAIDPSSPVPGIVADALIYGGGADRLIAPATDLSSGAWTLSAWFNATSFGTDPRIAAKAASDGSAVYELLVDDSSAITGQAMARLKLGVTTHTVSGGSVATGGWHHLVATWDGATIALYVDGALVDSTPAAGSIDTDLGVPLTIGNLAAADRGFAGIIDEVRLSHSAYDAARVSFEHANVTSPGTVVSVGAEQGAAPDAWTVSSAQARSGTSAALASEVTIAGVDAWLTASGLDEPGVEFTTWWWMSTATGVDLAAGTRAGPVATDQYETALTSASGWDLATDISGVRTQQVGQAGTPLLNQWVQVRIKTDENGDSSVSIDGSQVIAPTAQSAGLLTGSVGLRVGLLPSGQTWYVDDARARKLISDEPTVSVGPLERQ